MKASKNTHPIYPSSSARYLMQAKEKRIEEKKLTIVSAIEVESIHIPQNEAQNLYDSSVPIWNMTGEYMIGVEVFHQLHCLVSFLIKYLRILLHTLFPTGGSGIYHDD